MTDKQANLRWGMILNPGRHEVEVAQELANGGEVVYRRLPVGDYFAAIVIPSRRVVIEIESPGPRKQDKARTIREQGWKLAYIARTAPPGDIWAILAEHPSQG